MIDYEKLKIAHKLVYEHAQSQNETSTLTLVYYGTSEFEYYKWNSYSFGDWEYRDIDNLIAKIRELTAPKPKYEVGQEVWRINMFKQIENHVITEVKWRGDSYRYFVDYSGVFLSDNIDYFLSKGELINAQIEYWNKKNCEEDIHVDCEGDYECVWCGAELDDDSRKIKEISTRSDNVSMKPPFEGRVLGFNDCVRCGKQMADVPDHCECPDKLIKCNSYNDSTNELPIDAKLVVDHSEQVFEKVCEHLHDGVRYALPFAQGVGYKCTVCGEFYK